MNPVEVIPGNGNWPRNLPLIVRTVLIQVFGLVISMRGSFPF